MFITKSKKKIMSTIFCNTLDSKLSTIKGLADQFSVDEKYLQTLCEEMITDGLLLIMMDNLTLTEKGRNKIKIVFTGGVFDIIHPGHIFTFSSAKDEGDVLVVSVARNNTVRRSRNRDPLNDEVSRCKMVSSVKYVDIAILGSKHNIYETIELVKPNIIVIGYDQKHDIDIIKRESKNRGFSVKVLRLKSPFPNIKSSSIKNDRNIMESI